jgi:hypothetical protein
MWKSRNRCTGVERCNFSASTSTADPVVVAFVVALVVAFVVAVVAAFVVEFIAMLDDSHDFEAALEPH